MDRLCFYFLFHWIGYSTNHVTKQQPLIPLKLSSESRKMQVSKTKKRCDIRDFDKKLEEEVLKLTESGEVTLLMTSLLKTTFNLIG